MSYTDILPSYYVTFPANKDKRAYLNDTSGAFPLLYTLAGAGLVAYVSKSACMLRVALLVSDIFTSESARERSSPDCCQGGRDLSSEISC